MRKYLLSLYWTWAGIVITLLKNPKLIIELPRQIVGTFQSYRSFRSRCEDKYPILFRPIFFQQNVESSFDAHYVIQGWWATKRIMALKPSFHVDISSNVSFVTQLAASLPVRYYEFNPPSIEIPDLVGGSANLIDLHFEDNSIECLSCLHVLEHIGLGRYGDPIDPYGMQIAFKELSRCLKNGGYLLVSFPIGIERIEFNGQRIIDPNKIFELLPGLELIEFSYVNDDSKYVENGKMDTAALCNYGCGLFLLKK
jgi:hypothetical protein